MSHTFRLIVFDYDGTLVDSQRSIAATMAQAFIANGLAAPAPAAVRRNIGLKLEVGIDRLLPEPGDSAQVDRVAASYREAFFAARQRDDFDEPLFPGVGEGLRNLDRPPTALGIATGKSRRGILAGLERHGLRRHFVTVQTADDGPGKPHPELLLRAMADVGARPDETVLIGDTTYDMEMAVNAKIVGIGVAWGYHEPSELRSSGAARIVDRFDDLPAALAAVSEARACD